MDFIKQARKIRTRVSSMRKRVTPLLNRGLNGLIQLFSNKRAGVEQEVTDARYSEKVAKAKMFIAGEGIKQGDDNAFGELKTAQGELATAEVKETTGADVVEKLDQVISGDVAHMSENQVVNALGETGISSDEAKSEAQAPIDDVQGAESLKAGVSEGEKVQKRAEGIAEGQKAEIEEVAPTIIGQDEEEKKKEDKEVKVIGLADKPEAGVATTPGLGSDLMSGPTPPTGTKTGE